MRRGRRAERASSHGGDLAAPLVAASPPASTGWRARRHGLRLRRPRAHPSACRAALDHVVRRAGARLEAARQALRALSHGCPNARP